MESVSLEKKPALEAGGPKQETKNGLPVMSVEDVRRFYHTDAREHGEKSITTFDYQGYVRYEAPDYEPGVFYNDSMATNGLLKDDTQEGIHVGTDGIVDYSALTANRRMQGPEDVGEYDMYIKIPSKLQKKLGVVCMYDSCYAVEDRLERGDDEKSIKRSQDQLGWIVMRLAMDPKEDDQARIKAQFIHTQTARFIERGGQLDRVSEFVGRLEDLLEKSSPEEVSQRLELEPAAASSKVAKPVSEPQMVEREPGQTADMILNAEMEGALRAKLREYKMRLASEEDAALYQAPEVRGGTDFDIRDTKSKIAVVEALLSGGVNRDELVQRLEKEIKGFSEKEFKNAWGVIGAYNKNDLSKVRGGSGFKQ